MNTERIRKFVLLLGSDKPGEVNAAAAALCRALKADGHDLHDLVEALKGTRIIYRDKIVEKTKVVYPKTEELSPREIAQRCLDKGSERLNEREQRFIEDMSRRYGDPTERQRSWLFAIHDKLFARQR
jgi:hypothetical protein